MTIKLFKKCLAVFLLLVGLSAVAGGIGLLSPNGLGIPISDLAGSIFSSYLWPGIILAVIVGGTHLTAAWMLIRKSKYALEGVAVAGFGMLVWIFTEVCIVGYHSWLQPLYFALALATLISAMILLKDKSNVIIKP
jgi:hypothetical protein